MNITGLFSILCSAVLCLKAFATLLTEDELAQEIAHLSNDRAPRAAGILPEMVCHGGPTLFLSATYFGRSSVFLKSGDPELVPISKKGSILCCNNWHGIALLDAIRKVVGLITQTWLQHLAELEMTDSQCGFRQVRSCTDQIFSATQLIDKISD